MKVGLATMMSPRESLLRYGPLLDYLNSKLERHVEVVLASSQTEMLELLRTGGVQVGLVGSLAYVQGAEDFGLTALAVPEYHGDPTHTSLILVRRYSGLEEFSHLKGHTFAYTDPVSATGWLYPQTLVLELDEAVDRFFDRTLFTGSDDKAIQALDHGLVDGAAVNSLVYDLAVAEDPDLSRRLRVIASSEPLGSPPVVVSPTVGSELVAQLEAVFLEMAADDEGRSVLEGLGADRFVAPDPAWYEPIRLMLEAVEAGK
ncbi:MAG: phosphate/phosphite/phosphonate ABC transporter substrate-binding protein [Symbiobacterium thermophilum]|uniref:Phosphate/phosphite/phosphonate ABC transporter substrate-binding protein n=1 Tax=Symbiobacterium thermophilum TaxID=2734 RepID=A0A953I7F2_SYMTR|nr:phosphate/phosphite/phosphonate ABC transporter substrate-binding protein [Symbiobacterium thermophilum]